MLAICPKISRVSCKQQKINFLHQLKKCICQKQSCHKKIKSCGLFDFVSVPSKTEVSYVNFRAYSLLI